MPRRKRPCKTRGSEHWLRRAVNENTDALNSLVSRVFEWGDGEKINWLSPIRSDEYAEYYDHHFLERLGISGLGAKLNEFWPRGGPRWDGRGWASKNRDR